MAKFRCSDKILDITRQYMHIYIERYLIYKNCYYPTIIKHENIIPGLNKLNHIIMLHTDVIEKEDNSQSSSTKCPTLKQRTNTYSQSGIMSSEYTL